jgi:hypothetical protein
MGAPMMPSPTKAIVVMALLEMSSGMCPGDGSGHGRVLRASRGTQPKLSALAALGTYSRPT